MRSAADAVYAAVRLRAVETDPLGASPPRIRMRSKNGQWVALHAPRLTSARRSDRSDHRAGRTHRSRDPARPGTRAFDTRKPDLCPCWARIVDDDDRAPARHLALHSPGPPQVNLRQDSCA